MPTKPSSSATQSSSTPPSTLIIRHYKERLSKCSLHGLEDRVDLEFQKFPRSGKMQLPETAGWVTLALEAPALTRADAQRGLVLIDGTWKYAARMARVLEPQLAQTVQRSIPAGFRTGYPRRQTLCPDPEAGLASVEALYIAHRILGREAAELLDHYHWKDIFLELNAELLAVL